MMGLLGGAAFGVMAAVAVGGLATMVTPSGEAVFTVMGIAFAVGFAFWVGAGSREPLW